MTWSSFSFKQFWSISSRFKTKSPLQPIDPSNWRQPHENPTSFPTSPCLQTSVEGAYNVRQHPKHKEGWYRSCHAKLRSCLKHCYRMNRIKQIELKTKMQLNPAKSKNWKSLLICGIKTHVRDTDFSEHVREGLVVFICTNENESGTVGNLGTKCQNEEALAFSMCIDQTQHRWHIDYTVEQQFNDQSVGEPRTDIATWQILWCRTFKLLHPSQHIGRCPAEQCKCSNDQPLWPEIGKIPK